ncbi:MAG: nucleoside-diphosphate kinase [Elusimicrobia bacterium]|nr:nucleoside-diphosphate kinase [Elusimicrobiota bacterium]
MENNSDKKFQQTLVIVKPDGLKKSLTGNILTRLSEAKLRIVAAKVVQVSRELACKHYEHLKDKPFFDEVVKYIRGTLHGEEYHRVLAIIYEGADAIKKVREIAGVTNPEEADPTTIRGQYGRITTKGMYENVIHCSASDEEAENEIKLWFEPDDIVEEIYPVETIDTLVKKRVWKNVNRTK